MSRVHPAGSRHADVLPEDHPLPAPADLNALVPSVWPRGARRDDGTLKIGGVDVRDLARDYGTPLYVYDEDDFRSRCRDFAQAFSDGDVYYAGKAFLSTEIARWVAEEGLGLDVCSGGELAIALAAGFPSERITFHGNNKSTQELERALEANVGHIVLDSFEEIARLGYLAKKNDKRPKVMIRVTTGVEAHTHEFIATAHDDQKFGFAKETAREAARRVFAIKELELVGLHSHIGSQIFDTDGFELAARRVVDLLVAIRDEHGVELPELDLGGGYGIAYLDGDDPLDPKHIADNLRAIISRACEEKTLTVPRLTVEPGRTIAGPRRDHAVRGRHGQAARRPAHVRLRRRRHERQHQDGAVRRGVHLRARLPAFGGRAHAQPPRRQALRERRHGRTRPVAARRPRAGRPRRGGGDRRVLPLAREQLQPPPEARGRRRTRREGPR